MKYTAKIIVGSIGILMATCVFPVSVFAASTKDDCGLITLLPINKEKSQRKGMRRDQDVTIALNHLKAYCCKSVLGPKDTKKKLCENFDYPSSYPQSPYLFDHLIDVGLRKLDAIGLYTQENQQADQQGSEWRAFLTQVTTKPEGLSPQALQEKYVSYRKNPATGDNKLFDYIQPVPAHPAQKDYTTTNLFEKYMNRCAVSRDIYTSLQPQDAPIGKDKYYPLCRDVVASRVKKEFVLINVIMIESANRQIENSLKAYTDNFVQNRLMSLADKFTRTLELLGIIAKQAPLTKKCNK